MNKDFLIWNNESFGDTWWLDGNVKKLNVGDCKLNMTKVEGFVMTTLLLPKEK